MRSRVRLRLSKSTSLVGQSRPILNILSQEIEVSLPPFGGQTRYHLGNNVWIYAERVRTSLSKEGFVV